MLQLLSFAAREQSDWALLPVPCSVLVEKFLPLCFHKLPYVSICSTTAEWELTFQSASPCALWTRCAQVSTSTPFIMHNDWLTEWRPSVITSERRPLLLFHPLFLAVSALLVQRAENAAEFLFHLKVLSLAFALLGEQGCGLFNCRNNRQGSPAGEGSTDFSAGSLKDVECGS